MAQLDLEEEIQTQGRGSQAERLLHRQKCGFSPANNPVIKSEVRESQSFIILVGNQCIFCLGCSDLLVWSERSG